MMSNPLDTADTIAAFSISLTTGSLLPFHRLNSIARISSRLHLITFPSSISSRARVDFPQPGNPTIIIIFAFLFCSLTFQPFLLLSQSFQPGLLCCSRLLFCEPVWHQSSTPGLFLLPYHS